MDISAVLNNRRLSIEKREEIKEFIVDAMLERMESSKWEEYLEGRK